MCLVALGRLVISQSLHGCCNCRCQAPFPRRRKARCLPRPRTSAVPRDLSLYPNALQMENSSSWRILDARFYSPSFNRSSRLRPTSSTNVLIVSWSLATRYYYNRPLFCFTTSTNIQLNFTDDQQSGQTQGSTSL